MPLGQLQDEADLDRWLRAFLDRLGIAAAAGPAAAPLAPPRARVYNDGTVANALDVATAPALTFVPFNQERWDTDSIHDTVTNNTRLTCQTPGSYLIGGSVRFPSDPNGDRQLAVRLNGGVLIVGDERSAVSADATDVDVVTQYDLAAGDYVELRAWQSSGSTLTLAVQGNLTPEFWAVRVG